MNALSWSYNSLYLSSSDQEGNECLIVVLQQSLSVFFRPRRHWTPYHGLTTVSVCPLQTKKAMNALLWSYNSLWLSSSDQEGIECLIVVLQQSLSVFFRPRRHWTPYRGLKQSLSVLFRPRRQWTPYRGLTIVSVCPLQTKKALNTLFWSYNSLCLSSSDQEGNEYLIVVLRQSLSVLLRPR